MQNLIHFAVCIQEDVSRARGSHSYQVYSHSFLLPVLVHTKDNLSRFTHPSWRVPDHNLGPHQWYCSIHSNVDRISPFEDCVGASAGVIAVSHGTSETHPINRV